MEKLRRKSTGNCMEDHVSKETKRKKMKPITEKLRRDRINNSLEELKFLILNTRNKEVSSYTRMEKADILEMAVKYIKRLQGNQSVQKPNLVTNSATNVFFPNKLNTEPETTPICLSIPSVNHSSTPEKIHIETSSLSESEITVKTPSNETNASSKPFSCCTILEVNDNEISVVDSSRPKLIMRKPVCPMLSHHCTTQFDYSKRRLSPNKVADIGHAQNVRLPGMESFVQSRLFKRDILLGGMDKENSDSAFIDFNQELNKGWQNTFDQSQSAFRTEVNGFNVVDKKRFPYD